MRFERGSIPSRRASKPLVPLPGSLLVLLLTAQAGEEPVQAHEHAHGDVPADVPLYEQTESHRKMLALLADIRDRAPEEHYWLNDREARKLRERASALREDAPDFTRFELFLKLGEAEQRLGREREAIDNLTRAYDLLPKVEHELDEGIVPRVIFNLGFAHMRYGETQNCALGNNADSCLLPIKGDGIHRLPEGSRRAIEYFQEVLGRVKENTPGYLSALWLLNIAYMTVGDYPEGVPAAYLIPPEAFVSEEAFPRFPNAARRAGVDTFSLSGGAVAEDFDFDGYLDLLVSSYDPAEQVRLFLNDQKGGFTDRTTEAGLTGIVGGLNMVQADYDNDGDVDVLTLRGAWMGSKGRHPKSLLRNNGDGTFTDIAFDAGLAEVHNPSQTASWSDFDNDGDLDLYVGIESNPDWKAPCQLFVNRGDAFFEDRAASAGVENGRWTKGVVFGDYDADRLPDIYVSNLDGPNRLYRNQGNGTFSDVAPALGVTQPTVSFPTWFWDYNNDGILDIYVAAYDALIEDLAASYLGLPTDAERARLYEGDGKGGFRDVTRERNLERPSAPMGSNFGDLDGDGFLDFYLGTGYPPYFALMPNLMYHNRGGKSFADVTTAGGFGNLQKGHAVLFADLDRDGDQDVFEQMGGALAGDKFHDALYLNPGFGNRWLALELIGVRSNRSAIGARIRIDVKEKGVTRSIYKWVNSGGSFGASPLEQTVGLGKAERIESLEVYWPTSDVTQTFTDVPLNGSLRLREDWDRFVVR
jgi:hypothetical protein